MAFLINAGISITQATEILAQTTSNSNLKKALAIVSVKLNGGGVIF